MAGYMHPDRVRRPSERIRLKHSFSNFTNTKDNPLLVDMENDQKNESVEKEVAMDIEQQQDQFATEMEMENESVKNVKRCRKRKESTNNSDYMNVTGVELPMEDLSMTENNTKQGCGETVGTDIGFDTKIQKRRKFDSASCSRRTRSQTSRAMDINTPPVKEMHDAANHTSKGRKRSQMCRMTSSIKTKLKRSIQQAKGKKQMKQVHQNSRSQLKRGLEVLRTRTSPKALHDAIGALNSEQRASVVKLGLKSLLSMDIDGVPSKLGFFIVDNLDTTQMGIRVANGLLQVTVESIHKLTGLPTGGIDLLSEADVPSSENLIPVWKKQFEAPKIRPKHVVELLKKSTDSGFHFKINFLVLFVNLMIEGNSMGTVNLNFLSKLKSADMIGKVDWCKFLYDKVKISKQRWRRDNLLCFYSGPLTYLTLLYVDSTMSPSDSFEKQGLPICVWNMAMLKKRERSELQGGGFGLLPLKKFGIQVNGEEHVSMKTIQGGDKGVQGVQGYKQTQPKDAPSKKEHVSMKTIQGGDKGVQVVQGDKGDSSHKILENHDSPAMNGSMNDASHTATGNIPEPCKQTEPKDATSKKDLVKDIQERISRLIAIKVSVEIDLENAMSTFKDDEDFISLEREIQTLFGKNQESLRKADAKVTESHNMGQSPCMVLTLIENDPLEKMWDSPTFIREIDESVRLSREGPKSKKSLTAIHPPNFDAEVTPVTTMRSAKFVGCSNHGSEIIGEKFENMQNEKTNDINPLDFDLGLSPIKKAVPISVVNAVMIEKETTDSKGKEKVVEPKIECRDTCMDDVGLPYMQPTGGNIMVAKTSKRNVKPGEHLKSPYVMRVVDFNVTPEDDKVYEWAVAMFGSKYDAVFSAINCTNITRNGMESLAVANMNLDSSVINGWCSILNFEERLRSRNSPKRYFFRIDLMMDHMLRKQCYNIDEQYRVFKNALDSTTRHSQGFISRFKDIDLAFFPMYDGTYYYLVVINLKSPSFTIIDNRRWKKFTGEALKRRYGGITDVLQRMVVKHLYAVGHASAQMLLATEQDRVEMDWQTSHNTHDSGVFTMRSMESFMGDAKSWKAGFMIEGERQSNQIADLRKKYTTKLAKHGQNLKRNGNLTEICRITNMDDGIKTELIRQAEDSRWERL